MSNRIVKTIASIGSAVALSPIYIVTLIISIVVTFIGGIVDTFGMVIFAIEEWARAIKDDIVETKQWINNEDLEYRLVNVKETEKEG